jgi:hypothetical protein
MRIPSYLARALTGVLLINLGPTIGSAQIPGLALVAARIEPGTLAQDGAEAPALHIVILKGDRGINIIKKKTAVAPVVEVRDRNNLPVAGAAVTFTSPSQGASAVFLNGSRSVTTITDASGRATALGLKPINPGGFQIGVSATFQSQIATATIPMTNAMTAAAAAATAAGVGGTVAGGGAAGLSAGVVAAIIGAGAAAAAGVAVGLTHHGGASPAATTTATIGVGSGGTFGSPH